MRMAGWAVVWLLGMGGVVWAQGQAPPPMSADEASPDTAPPAMSSAGDATGLNAPPALSQGSEDSGMAPPSMEGSASLEAPATPLAPSEIPPPPQRPFLQRLNVLEVGLMAGALAGGWAAALVTHVVATAVFTSVAAGRPAYDLPVLVVRGALEPTSTDTGLARLFGAAGGAWMLGALAVSALTGAVFAGLVAAALSNLSQDWSTAPGPVVASGLLAAAVCMAGGTALFLGSLLVPVPPLWVATFALAGLVCVVVPPVAVAVGQLVTKTARPVPGGIIYKLLEAALSNPMIRQKMGGL
jgi:hypothetical protein